jgi:hypothetical protein
MDATLQDVIAAFVDGEPVTPDELHAALAHDEGREYLVDLLVLRGLVRPAGGAELAPASGTAGASAAALASSRPAPRLFWSAAAAALVAISSLAGFAAGRMTGAEVAPGTPAVTVQAAPPPAFAIDAPAPTRVIELKHGKDWNERSGGN